MKRNLLLAGALVLLLVIGWYAWNSKTSNTLAEGPLMEFTIADTSAVSKIFITDVDQKSVTLERVPGQKLWKLNGKYFAKESGVDLLLKTFNRMRVRSSVPEKMKENVLRIMAASGRKVEVYTGGDQPSKIYYIGTATPDHNGTYMVLEIPGKGRSDVPYIINMEGSTGYLSTRFHTNEEDWRYSGIFEYPELELNKVEVKFFDQPELSFNIQYHGGNDIQLYNYTGERINTFDTSEVKNYLLLFKKVHFDTFNSGLNALQEDSLKRTSPSFSVAVTDNTEELKHINLYWKKAVKEVLGPNGQPYPMDLEHLYGVMDNGDVVLCQHYVFDPLLPTVDQFYPKK